MFFPNTLKNDLSLFFNLRLYLFSFSASYSLQER